MMTRPAFGGNLMATILCKEHRPQMSTVRPGVMRMGKADPSRQGAIEDVSVALGHSTVDTCIQHYLQSFRTVVGRASDAYASAMLGAA